VEHLPIWGVLVAGDDLLGICVNQGRDVAIVVADDPVGGGDGVSRPIDLSRMRIVISRIYRTVFWLVKSKSVLVSIPGCYIKNTTEPLPIPFGQNLAALIFTSIM